LQLKDATALRLSIMNMTIKFMKWMKMERVMTLVAVK